MSKKRVKQVVIIIVAIVVVTYPFSGIFLIGLKSPSEWWDDRAQTLYVDGISYRITSTENMEVAVDGAAGLNINIPSEVRSEKETYSVTSIGVSAFSKSDIISIIIPHSVTKIDVYAFYECKELERVTIENTSDAPSKLETIGEAAFYDSAIMTMTIPQSVTTIGESSFRYCKALTNVKIISRGDAPSKLETVGKSAFFGTGITAIDTPQSVNIIGESAFEY